MCDPVTIIASVGTALLAKKVTDDAAKKQEKAYKAQIAQANEEAANANKKFLEQQASDAVNPNLVKKTGAGDTGTDALKIKKTAGAAMNTLGMGGASGTGVNIA
tara:strand:- start:930 stop:1241 length:312 start_codon:yes stop_codon:yes gene_type:complete